MLLPSVGLLPFHLKNQWLGCEEATIFTFSRQTAWGPDVLAPEIEENGTVSIPVLRALIFLRMTR